MELYKEILAHALIYADIKINFPEHNVSEIVEGTCYLAVKRIKAIIEDDSLEDGECFMQIEEIVRTLEEIGSSGGSRHDF